MSKSLSERGQALIVIIFAIIGLVGITGLVIDSGSAYSDRRKAQNAADAAALAGALERINGQANWVSTAYQSALENGYNNDGVTNVVQVNSPPASGPHAGEIEYIQVKITSHVNSFFADVVGVTELTNQVEAVSRTIMPQYKPILGGAAIISLAPTSKCLPSQQGLLVWDSATLEIWDAGIFVNSNNESCAFMKMGSGSLILQEKYALEIVGGAYIPDAQREKVTPYPPTTGARPVLYPPPFYMPKVGCSKEALVSEDGTSMSSGSWGDDFPPEGVHELESGVYCLGGDFIVSGPLRGSNVVFKVGEGRVHWDGGQTTEINLRAPKVGLLAGLLLYLPIDNHSRVALNGGPKSDIRGTILAPGSNIVINGMGQNGEFHSQIIGYRVEVKGDDVIHIKYKDEQNYDALTKPELQFAE